MNKILLTLFLILPFSVFSQDTEVSTKNIQAITIKDKSDPRAIKILDRVISNFDKNSPKSLDSYAFKSYEKMSMDLDKDSILYFNDFKKKWRDSVALAPKQPNTNSVTSKKVKPKTLEQKKKDSLEKSNADKMFRTSQLFLWERARQFLYAKQYGEKTIVMDNRISGINSPIYEILTFKSNLQKIPKQVLPENRINYRYHLADTITVEGRKTLVINFRELEKNQQKNRRKYTGKILVDAATFALKKIESNSKKRNDGLIVSTWKPIDNAWFLTSETMKIKIGNVSFAYKTDSITTEKGKKKIEKKRRDFGQYVYINNQYYDFYANYQPDPEDFKGYTYSIENSDGKLLSNYRKDSLTTRESNTYTTIDSIGKTIKLDQKINFYKNLAQGKWRKGMVDFDLLKLAKYNQHEGLRVGLGIKINEKWNPYFSPDAYFAYGTKDHSWKYGAGLDIKTTLERNSFFRLEFQNDVNYSGKFSQEFWNFDKAFSQFGSEVRNTNFYQHIGGKISYITDLGNTKSIKITTKYQDQKALFPYQFLGKNNYKDASIQLSFYYAPNQKNIMTESGKYNIETKTPEFFFNYEKGFKTLGSILNYDKIDAFVSHDFTSKLGKTSVKINGGILLGNSPIWNHFEMGGLIPPSSSNTDFYKLNFGTYLNFATMQSSYYYNDRFIATHFLHQLPFYFKFLGKRTSSFSLIYKNTIGNFKNPENHQLNFQKMDKLYQEIGISYDHFLGKFFNLSLSYRIGYYQMPSFKDNFSVQVKINLPKF